MYFVGLTHRNGKITTHHFSTSQSADAFVCRIFSSNRHRKRWYHNVIKATVYDNSRLFGKLLYWAERG